MRLRFYLTIAGLALSAGWGCAQAQAPAAKPAEVLEGEGAVPRAAPTDYQVQAKAGSVTIAADFSGHVIPTPDGLLNTEDFIVVEAALFGAQGEKLALSYKDFSLRVNGSKKILDGESYALVDIRDPEWAPLEPEKSKTSFGSSSGGGSANDPPPTPPKPPFDLQRKWVLRVKKLSFPEGERVLPSAGLLFFRYHGKEKGIHDMELIYAGPAGKTTLKLQAY